MSRGVREPHRGIAGVSIAVGVLLLLFFADGLPRAVEITFDLGTPGTYVIGDQPQCGIDSPDRCASRTGTFTSDDGQVTRNDIRLAGSLRGGFDQGDRVRAFDVGEPREVYSPETRFGNPAPLVFVPFGTGLLAIVLGSLYLWWHRDRD